MENTESSSVLAPLLQKVSDKKYGPCGIVGAVFALFVPILVFFGVKKKQRGIPIEGAGGEPGYVVRNAKAKELMEVPWKGAVTIAALFEQSCKRHSSRKCLGKRKFISKEYVTGSDGRKFEKLHLGEYMWQTYTDVFDRASNFASGLVNIGHGVNERAAIFADTQAEWFIAFHGCFRQSVTIVTIYSSLGEEALIHSLNETQVSTLICDYKQLKKLSAIQSSLKSIKNIIYIEEDGTENDYSKSKSTSDWTVSSFSEVENLGKRNPVQPNLPSKNDIAVIMYTSGSTGFPKGVMITHGNLVATAAGVVSALPELLVSDSYLGYLPLAHVFELEAETVLSASGVAIGYGSALTITDTSSKIKRGTKGDVSMLRPTLMTAVPAILDRVREGVLKKVDEKGGMARSLFNIAYNRRLSAIEGSWFGAWGVEKILWDIIVFKKVRAVLGGKIRGMLIGGAPLSRDSQRFINICMGAPIGQGYGLTETVAGATFSELMEDNSVGRVGPPIPSCYIKLVSWEEGGYRFSDKPMPRGEVVVGGYTVSAGYFNNQEKTDEVFKVDEKGMRWFYTGDIGQFHSDGCLEIIDRKKDIVKLQHGEYVSLGKVEAGLSSSKYVDNIMIHADPFHNSCVALIVPTAEELEKWAKEAGISYNDFAELCNKPETITEVKQSLIKVGKETKLEKYDYPAKIKLIPEQWTPDSGLVTAAFKIKREQLKAKYKDDLAELYK